ncbi:flagellar protein FlaG [Photobacterium atrarenae]|uniref:Flagellar protein FlaG n=1 Tax=Photobacterium atrarenae TaxID=865757 RepID=A0ABY5GCW6_9GAMM|nr:flagellar protein FlaG [Photobacterium atrarenae]UTV27036.1 flagellar protein FlaG [Photobacterium atrarenae]
MDVKSVSTSSLLSRSAENGTHSSVGTSIANKSKSQSPESPAATTTSGMHITASSDHGKSDVRRVEQSANAEQQHQLQREQLEKVVARIEEFVGTTLNKGLAFRIDEESGKNVVTIYDKRTGEVVRQIPDEEMLSLSRQLAHHSGGLVTTKV